MAEEFSFRPPDESDILRTHEDDGDGSLHEVIIPHRKRSAAEQFKMFIGDLFRSKEQQDDDDDELSPERRKKRRFARAFSRLFGGRVVQKEEIAEDGVATSARGIFFEQTPVEASESGQVTAEQETPENSEPAIEAVAPNNTAPDIETVESHDGSNSSESNEVPARVLADERFAYMSGAAIAERRRAERAEHRAKRIERDAERLQKKVDRIEVEQNRASNRTEVVGDARKKTEAIAVRPEMVREAVQRVVESQPERKVEQAGRKLDVKTAYRLTPELAKKVEQLEDEEAKEKAYELSHEHKDMDKQAANSWAVLQQAADEQAKKNAAALQAATKAASDAALQQKAANQKLAGDYSQLYKRAAATGFTTAAIIIVIIIIMLLVQSR